MRVAVIGATGFIGRDLCAVLAARGVTVRALARPRAAADRPSQLGEFQPVNVSVPRSLPKALADVDAVVNLAGLSRANRDPLYDRVNVDGARNVAQTVVELGIPRLIHVSHLGAQGPSLDGTFPAEPGHEAPMDAHGRSRLRGEQAVLQAAPEAACVLRPAWVTDAEDPQLHRLTSLVRTGLAPTLPDQALSFVTRTSLNRLIADLCAATRPPPGPHFIADGSLTVAELLDIIERNAGGRPALRLPVSQGLLARLVPVAERVAGVVGVGQGWGQWLRALTAGSWVCDPHVAAQRLGFEPDPDIIRHLSDAVRAQA